MGYTEFSLHTRPREETGIVGKTKLPCQVGLWLSPNFLNTGRRQEDLKRPFLKSRKKKKVGIETNAFSLCTWKLQNAQAGLQQGHFRWLCPGSWTVTSGWRMTANWHAHGDERPLQGHHVPGTMLPSPIQISCVPCWADINHRCSLVGSESQMHLGLPFAALNRHTYRITVWLYQPVSSSIMSMRSAKKPWNISDLCREVYLVRGRRVNQDASVSSSMESKRGQWQFPFFMESVSEKWVPFGQRKCFFYFPFSCFRPDLKNIL